MLSNFSAAQRGPMRAWARSAHRRLAVAEGVVPESALAASVPCVSSVDVLPTTCASFGRPAVPLRAGAGSFVPRMLGPSESERETMLKAIGAPSLDELTAAVVPEAARDTVAGFALKESETDFVIPERGVSEAQAVQLARDVLGLNDRRWRSYIGRGYHNTHTPAVVANNVLLDPAWYSPYTPYQAEASQGRLEALWNFQEIIKELTGLPQANAGLLDVGSATCEAAAACLRARELPLSGRPVVLIERSVDRHVIDVMRAKLGPAEFELYGFDLSDRLPPLHNVVCCVLQTPDISGHIFTNLTRLASACHDADAKLVAITDPLALVLFEPPGKSGADIVIGSSQRLGVPMGYGGPAAAFFATTNKLIRQLPGRIVTEALDSRGNPAYRLGLQTREQHIRREKATSNICTAQSLPAVVSQFFVLHHGPEGLKKLASSIFERTVELAEVCREMGFSVEGENSWLAAGRHFGVVTIRRLPTEIVRRRADQAFLNFAYEPNKHHVRISVDEMLLDPEAFKDVCNVLRRAAHDLGLRSCAIPPLPRSPPVSRTELFQAPHHKRMFARAGHNDTMLQRYIRHLASKDIGLHQSMVPLGSCTMKHNPVAPLMTAFGELGMGSMHPLAPPNQAWGSLLVISMLSRFLAEITGLECVSLQPNAGSAGEVAGLRAVRAFHEQQGDPQRNVCFIPESAHGTNSASATTVGLSTVPVKLTKNGEIDLRHLEELCASYDDQLACLMLTYPSTWGVFETDLGQASKLVHERGGLVYVDGANLNAAMGLKLFRDIDADVCHVNLHKTFGIPHGGGGPGVGPVCVKPFLRNFLPSHRWLSQNRAALSKVDGITLPDDGQLRLASTVSPFGSASLLVIPWMYILMLGREGLRLSSQTAILNANYVRQTLKRQDVPVRNAQHKYCGHEFLVDLSQIPGVDETVTVEDIAKRLIDFGFHAPTLAWPLPNALMIEPTESEDKASLDRFADAIIAIFDEIRQLQSSSDPLFKQNNPLHNAPHTLNDLLEWNEKKPYSATQACRLPTTHKYWPAVNRIDAAASDRAVLREAAKASDVALDIPQPPPPPPTPATVVDTLPSTPFVTDTPNIAAS